MAKKLSSRTAGVLRQTAGGSGPARGVDRNVLAEVLSNGGLGIHRVATEVLYMLPDAFVREYTGLFHAALNAGEDGMGLRDDAKTELGRVSGKNTPGKKTGDRIKAVEGAPEAKENTVEITLKGTKSKSRGAFAIRDEKALAEKDRIDRVLRKLARQIKNEMDETKDGNGGEVLRCGQGINGKRVTVRVERRDSRGAIVGRVDKPGGCWKFLEAGWRYCPYCGFQNIADDMLRRTETKMKG